MTDTDTDIDTDADKYKFVSIDDIPIGSEFKAPEHENASVSEEDIKKAEKWWKSLAGEQKVKLYHDIQEAIHIH